jgi:hypothetical protein
MGGENKQPLTYKDQYAGGCIGSEIYHAELFLVVFYLFKVGVNNIVVGF